MSARSCAALREETAAGRITAADTLSAAIDRAREVGAGRDGLKVFVWRDDGSCLISGWMPALEFAELLGIPPPASRSYQTCAGFLLQEFGTIPGVGDKIDAGGWRFEIVDLDRRRIDKVLASRLDAV